MTPHRLFGYSQLELNVIFPRVKADRRFLTKKPVPGKERLRLFPHFTKFSFFGVSFDWFLALLVFSVIGYMAATHARLTLFHHII